MLINKIQAIKGNVIALIYAFENEEASGFSHYTFWKSEVISAWLTAVEELGCIPYMLDVRTFMQKASMGTLPHIDYCVNLNAGNRKIDNLCLVPSICSFLDIPCIPCNAITCAVGEDKYYANLIAQNGALKVPKKHPENVVGGIIRDRSFGSSVGIRLTTSTTKCSNSEISQAFIMGTDMTVPILYNPVYEKLEVLPPVLYKNNNDEKTWFLNETTKLNHSYEKVLGLLSDETIDALLELAKKFDIRTLCRFDTRVENYNFDVPQKIQLKDINFIEINPTPTINNTINFSFSLSLSENSVPHKKCFEFYKTLVKNASLTGYILFCSINAIKATHFRLQD